MLVFSVFMVKAENENAPQLEQLASEISGYIVGTPDGTFQSVTYEDGKLVFRVNANSQLNKQFYSTDDFAKRDELLDATLLHIFSGDSGVQIMTFLEQTRTQILWMLPLPGGNGQCSEKSVWPGDMKAKLLNKK